MFTRRSAEIISAEELVRLLQVSLLSLVPVRRVFHTSNQRILESAAESIANLKQPPAVDRCLFFLELPWMADHPYSDIACIEIVGL